MDSDSKEWLENLYRINGFDRTSRELDGRRPPRRITSNDIARAKLGAILKTDKLALIVTNRRARAGQKPARISR